MEFSEKMQAIRIERNLSQEEMAELIGVSRQAVAKWEAGLSYPDIDNLIKISDLLRVSLDRLLRPDTDGCNMDITGHAERSKDAMIDFLCRAKRATYAGHGGEEASPCRPASHDLKYTEGGYFYMDTYLGGERFSGQEAVWENGAPVWAMNYCGRVLSEKFSGDFLKEALERVPQEAPFRGPCVYSSGDYSYHCSVSGGFDWFQGLEEIYCEGVKVMECCFHGGSVA